MTVSAGSLDANVLLRLLLNDVADQHQAVVKLFERSVGKFSVADTAIIEIVFVLERHYQFSRSAIVETIEGLMSLTAITCNQPLFVAALPLFSKHSGLSFEDCCLAVYAGLNNAEPLWTFDRKLAKQTSSAKLLEIS
jgi:predicted nucleic-acid-binding protein